MHNAESAGPAERSRCDTQSRSLRDGSAAPRAVPFWKDASLSWGSTLDEGSLHPLRGSATTHLSLDGHVARHVQYQPIGVSEEEATNTPWLVGEWVDDLQPQPSRFGVHGVDVGDLKTDVYL